MSFINDKLVSEGLALATEIRDVGLKAGAEVIERLAYRLQAFEEDDGKQIVVDALASLLVKTAHKERDKALEQVQRLKKALNAIRDMKLSRKVDFRSRSDNQPSCYDLCKHKVMMKDTCEDCIMDFAAAASEGIE